MIMMRWLSVPQNKFDWIAVTNARQSWYTEQNRVKLGNYDRKWWECGQIRLTIWLTVGKLTVSPSPPPPEELANPKGTPVPIIINIQMIYQPPARKSNRVFYQFLALKHTKIDSPFSNGIDSWCIENEADNTANGGRSTKHRRPQHNKRWWWWWGNMVGGYLLMHWNITQEWQPTIIIQICYYFLIPRYRERVCSESHSQSVIQSFSHQAEEKTKKNAEKLIDLPIPRCGGKSMLNQFVELSQRAKENVSLQHFLIRFTFDRG